MSTLPWHRPERRAHALSLLVGIVTLATAGYWLLGLPGVESLPAWFYRPLGPRALSITSLSLALGIVPIAVWAAVRAARRHRSPLAWLVVASLAAQVGVIGMDDGTVLSRMAQGHGEFFRIAHERRASYFETMREYETLSASGALGGFAPSKPPGTLSFYVLMDVLGELPPMRQLAAPLADVLRSHRDMSTRAEGVAAGALLMPLFTALALIPLYFLARRLGGTRQDGVAAAVLYATAPGLLLISYHADGALFPLLAVGTVALAVSALREADARRWFARLAASGAVFAIGIWCNFSLIPLVGMLGVLLWVMRGERGEAPLPALRGVAIDVGVLLAAALVVLGALWATGLFAHPLDRFTAAMEHHRLWKSDAIGGVFGAVGAIEYWLWAGLPLLAVSLVALGPALLRWARWQSRPGDAMVLAAFAVHLVMAVATGCVEAARLWMWVTPFFALLAARTLRASAPAGASEQLWVELAASQLALTLVMRFCQPW